MRPIATGARRRTVLADAAFGLLAPGLARAQKFPTRAVPVIVPQPPGGAADHLARMLGERLEALWKQPVVLDNKPGGGVIGTQVVVRAPADGHTIGLLVLLAEATGCLGGMGTSGLVASTPHSWCGRCARRAPTCRGRSWRGR